MTTLTRVKAEAKTGLAILTLAFPKEASVRQFLESLLFEEEVKSQQILLPVFL